MSGIAFRPSCELGKPLKAMLSPAGTVSPDAVERTAWLVLPAEFEDDFYGQQAGSTEDEVLVPRLQ